MKKCIIMFMILSLLLSFSACDTRRSESNETSSKQNTNLNNDSFESQTKVTTSQRPELISPKGSNGIDVDLTVLSSTMVYSEVYNMMTAPEGYVGKSVKMKGQFAYYEDPETKNQYFACIIADATACCSQGLEFVLKGEYSYPNDYPKLGTEITVTGTFKTYQEDGATYCQLVDASLVT
ncbi:MAG TPA: hypothetical protein DCS04_00160 [Ruminococcaceae bacterium]|nr:hypothetical protein [Oscillospiraceae bacterium]